MVNSDEFHAHEWVLDTKGPLKYAIIGSENKIYIFWKKKRLVDPQNVILVIMHYQNGVFDTSNTLNLQFQTHGP